MSAEPGLLPVELLRALERAGLSILNLLMDDTVFRRCAACVHAEVRAGDATGCEGEVDSAKADCSGTVLSTGVNYRDREEESEQDF